MTEPPFGVGKPQVQNTKACLCCIDDHLGKSDVMIHTWWSGEGFTLRIDDLGKSSQIDISWTQWEAIKLSVDAVLDQDGE